MTSAARSCSRVQRVGGHEYAFSSTWQLPAPAKSVLAVLRDLWSYPEWWPEFKRAEQTAEDEGDFALRSRLPLTLNFSLRRDIEDHRQGVLRARVAGDIAGTVEWRIEPADQGTSVAFMERVTLQHPLARRTDILLRPILEWNHRGAMSSGERGLLRHLGIEKQA